MVVKQAEPVLNAVIPWQAQGSRAKAAGLRDKQSAVPECGQLPMQATGLGSKEQEKRITVRSSRNENRRQCDRRIISA
jgi:hypothetical protein